jgi:hypothetical protein
MGMAQYIEFSLLIENPHMGNTQYGNGHVSDQVECSINGIQQELLQNSICIL